MDYSTNASDNLDALANLLTELSVNSFDIRLHVQHINLARSLPEMESQVTVAQEMAANYLAVGDEVWLPLIEAKVASADLDNPADALEVLDLHTRAEGDYLSIPILQKHIEFLVDRHTHFTSLETKPDDLGELFSTAWTRAAISEVVGKGAGHLTKRDWELEMIEIAPVTEKPALVEHIEALHLMRLQQPHTVCHEDTYQSYSSFTTSYKPATEYELLLVSASKLRSRAVKAYERREPSEFALTSLDAYIQYIASERRGRAPDVFVITGLYERAIAEAAKRHFGGEDGAERVLRMFWVGYLDFLRTQETDKVDMTRTLRRATRSVPGSGEVWARYIRHLERKESDDSEDVSLDSTESISDAYHRALSTNLFTKANAKGPERDPEEIIHIVLARAGAEKRAIEDGRGDEDAFGTLVKVVEEGLVMVRQASKTGDQRFRLEKFLSEIYLSLADVPEAAVQMWESTASHYKTTWSAWIAYTDYRHDIARTTFQNVSTKNLDYPEAVWDAWISFEHAHGSLAELERCSAQKAYEAAQYAMEQQAATSVPVHLRHGKASVITGDGMDIEAPATSGELRGKRKASDEPELDVMREDRENCTVFVADLPSGTTEGAAQGTLTPLSQCGEVRDVKITNMPETVVATVEFTARDSIPAALTKDKKRVDGMEVSVHLAWRSTLYVTNFPEKTDDAAIRDLFGQYGLIFDVRWPSKKFKMTRRFCYVQFTSPASAERALELHGRELEPERTLTVYISNPERKKERTDAAANERELYVAGLSKFTTKQDLQGVFSRYGPIKEIRLAEDKNGQIKGFAFVEFEEETPIPPFLQIITKLKKRRIAVTLADTHVRSKNREGWSETGLGRHADARNRSIRIRNLPSDTQEGLLQQVLEKYAVVKRTEFFAFNGEAIVELENASEAGKLLLRTEPIVFNGVNLLISEETSSGSSRPQPGAPPGGTGGMFIPRTAASRPRAGIGAGKPPATNDTKEGSSVMSIEGKGQDDFRKMLG
ncbi:hypothetical protein BU15DRAFT_86759 [Melanogaster broomeanus]|nr:hypothetical protein BU15DRAFT_86759 [Melanogaster broomeanus]